MSDARPVLLIDFSALFRRAWHVQTEISHAFESTIGGVNRARGMLPEALVAICCDGRGNWRKELSPEYKAQRESQPAVMYSEMERTIERLKRDGHLVWKFDGFEADDVIATAVQRAVTRGHWCRIVSHDKDLLQLLSVACDYLAIHKNPWELVDRDIVVNKYGVNADQFADWLALVGDTSDNVRGCPGVGAGTATDLIKAYVTIDEMRKALLDKCDKCIDGKIVENDKEKKCKNCNGTGNYPHVHLTPNVRKNLSAFLNDGGFELARKLVSLSREVPLNFDEIYETREIQSIDDGDPMDEMESDAERYFGPKHVQQKEASAQPETVAAERMEKQPEAAVEGVEKNTKGPPPVANVEEKKEVAPKTAEPAKAPADVQAALDYIHPTEIVTSEYSKQLEPRSLRETVIYCRLMFNSRIYHRYPTVQSMVAAVVRGREMGFGAGASLDMFHVADFNQDGNLRLMMHAHLIIDLAMKDPETEYFMLVSSDDKQCTYEAKIKRNPKPTSITYTIEQATQANLVRLTQRGKPNLWMMRPTEQLRKTCGVQLARVVSPGRTLGLYCAEEMGIDE